jgi:DNA-binding transcriptional LysR family regulator
MADEVAELQLFVEIVKAGNLSAAARALNSSPVAMSRGLSALESRLGVRLVTRTSRTFELTEEGHLFYERAFCGYECSLAFAQALWRPIVDHGGGRPG